MKLPPAGVGAGARLPPQQRFGSTGQTPSWSPAAPCYQSGISFPCAPLSGRHRCPGARFGVLCRTPGSPCTSKHPGDAGIASRKAGIPPRWNGIPPVAPGTMCQSHRWYREEQGGSGHRLEWLRCQSPLQPRVGDGGLPQPQAQDWVGRVGALKRAQFWHSDTSMSPVSAPGEPTGVVRAPLETHMAALATLTNSPAGTRAPTPSPHLQNPPHQDCLGLFSHQQQATTIGTASPTLRKAKPHDKSHKPSCKCAISSSVP